MSILIRDPKTANTHLDNLKSLFEGNQSQLEWLVVAHSDPVMTNRLAEVVDGKNAVLLKVPQGKWKMDADGLPAAVKWAINEAGVKHLLIVGHSQADVANSEAAWLGNAIENFESEDESQSSYDRLVAGVRQSRDQIRRAQDHFATQITYLIQDERLREDVVAGRVQLHLLFYIARSGAFLRYNLATNEFKPLAT